MIVEQRTYTFAPGKLNAWLDLYKQYGSPVSEKHGIKLEGFFVVEMGPLNQVVFLRSFASYEEREKKLAARDADPGWAEFRKHTGPLGALVAQENKILKPTPFSPIR